MSQELQSTENHETLTDPFTDHIDVGLALIKAGDGKVAYEHFVYDRLRLGFHWPVSQGMIFPVIKLETEYDLVSAASTVARHSRASDSSAEIGGWYIQPDYATTFDTTKEQFKQEFVERFYQEVGIVAAEEWLHLQQYRQGGSLMGIDDPEVDVMVFLAQQGVALSADFLTRYSARKHWALQYLPERTEELQAFAKEYGR